MVQADISQLSKECSNWRDSLRSYREKISKYQNQLQTFARTPLSKDDLQEVEHFHNQFHIQLINVHDLKQSIKLHDRKVQLESASNGSQVDEKTINEHEKLLYDYEYLTSTLDDLGNGFKQLVKVVN